MNCFLVLIGCCIVVSAFVSGYQIYKMVELDALSKGLKHPKFWGLFSVSSQCGGLVLYLIGSRKYLSSWSDADQSMMNSRRKKAIISSSILVVSSIALMFILVTKY